MSYTMTIDEPKEAAWFEETSRTMTPSELAAPYKFDRADAYSEGEFA